MKVTDSSIQFFREKGHKLPVIPGLDRSLAMSIYQSLGFPEAKMEKWQKSKIRQWIKKDYSWSFEQNPESLPLVTPGIEISHLAMIGFVNGSPASENQWFESPEGILAGNLKEALRRRPELVNAHLNRYIKEDLNGLSALNNALFSDGFFLYVPAHVQGSLPVYWINRAIGSETGFSQMRNLLIIEPGASFELLHSDDTRDHGSLFRNNVTEVFIGANASLNWYVEQDLREDDGLVNTVFSEQQQDSRLNVLHTSLRGNMIRNEVHVKLNGTGCDTRVMGLYLPVSGEQVDNQVFVDHAMPHCESFELFKGVLDGSGHSIFNGHILVRQDAQKTNAYQTNRNIVLSDEASAFAKPFLEIYADDVKCSHGATIGQLDSEALFYLRSRGLSEEKARGYLVRAFVGEVIEKCGNQAFREYIEQKVIEKLHVEK